jgi:predicted secreted protein
MTISEIIQPTVLISAYAVLWFLCLFCLFPVGLGEIDPETGAPKSPKLRWKMICATIIAAVLWSAFYGAIWAGWIEL